MKNEADRLGRWLADWRGFRALEDGEPLPQSTEEGDGSLAPPARCRPQPHPTASGQIRLLRPACPVTGSRLRFVAVIEVAGDGGALVAPFSPLAEPATPDELLTSHSQMHLRVIEVWNRVWVSSGHIDDSWYVAALDTAEIGAVKALIGESAPDPERVGVPIRHSRDPRWVYRRRERFWIERWAASVRYGAADRLDELPRAAEALGDE